MVLRMLVDIAGGIGFLHAQEPAIVHSNLKTPNILVDKSWRCKVADLWSRETQTGAAARRTSTESKSAGP